MDFSKLTPEDLEALAAKMREEAAGTPVEPKSEATLGREVVEQHVAGSLPASPPQDAADPYAATATAWADGGYDFRTPSGALCRMRSIPVATLAAKGILDKLTRLPGLTQELVDQAEGVPPTKVSDNALSSLSALAEMLNELLPEVVIKPTIYPVPKDGQKVQGRIYVDSVPLKDQLAILTEAVGGVAAFDTFRK